MPTNSAMRRPGVACNSLSTRAVTFRAGTSGKNHTSRGAAAPVSHPKHTKSGGSRSDRERARSLSRIRGSCAAHRVGEFSGPAGG